MGGGSGGEGELVELVVRSGGVNSKICSMKFSMN